MATDLYKLCATCGGIGTTPGTGWIACPHCRPMGVIPAGITREDVEHMQYHLDEGAVMMTALRAEVTRLEGLLEQARDEIDRLRDENEARLDR